AKYHFLFGQLKLAEKDSPEAERAFLKALQLFGEAADLSRDVPPQYQFLPRDSTRELASLGSHARATEVAEAWVKNRQASGELLYAAALVHVISGAKVGLDAKLAPAERQRVTEKFFARSVELFRQAHNLGFFQNPENLKRLKKTAIPDLFR